MNPPLAHTLLTAPGRVPQSWLLFLHGVLGSGSNWRSFARRLVDEVPQWGAVLVDLRMHGGSQGLAAPHTLSAAAEDLVGLEAQVPGPVRGVLGHSLGGKVALAYAGRRAEALRHLFVLDSNPGVRSSGAGSEETLRVLEFLDGMPPHFPAREDFVRQAMEAGFDRSLAQWLAMNLEKEGSGFRFGLELDAIHALIEDYLNRDLWPTLEALPPGLRVDVLIGGRSWVLDGAARERLASVAHVHPNVHVDVLPQAGHWLHVDDPEGCYRLVRGAL
jgi:pimeloyl-ACP methyl ester carboxylesterase